jgi:DNA-binding NarL/FixJ family response regulator
MNSGFDWVQGVEWVADAVAVVEGDEVVAAAVPRVVLTDLRMGGMDGMALFDQRPESIIECECRAAVDSTPEAKTGFTGFEAKVCHGRIALL